MSNMFNFEYGVKMLFVLNIFIFLSCSNKKHGIIITNIDPSYEIFNEIFLDKKQIYLVGEKSDKIDFNSYKTVILKSKDKRNRVWEKIDKEIPGMNHIALLSTKYIYLVNRVFDKGAQYKDAQMVLFRFNRDKNQYEILHKFNDQFIKSLIFCTKDTGFAFSREGGKNFLLKTIDGGINWSCVKEIDGIIGTSVVKDNKIYFYTWTKNGKFSKFYVYDIKLKEFEILFKNNFILDDFHVDNKDVCWFLGENENNKAILKRFTKGNWENVKEFKLSSKKLYKYSKFIAVLTYGVDESLLGGLGGTYYLLNVSFDNGENWEEINLPDDTFVSPNSFYKDQKFVAYSGNGKITIINFNK